jgi:hypothetical protein
MTPKPTRKQHTPQHIILHLWKRWFLVLSCMLLASALAGLIVPEASESIIRNQSAPDCGQQAYNPTIGEMVAEVNESALRATVQDLQSNPTRAYGTAGNTESARYLYTRLTGIPGLQVEYQGGDLNNIVATLPGADTESDAVVLVGAHYDSISSDPEHAPGATDNGCGVAIVLELARVMSKYSFDHTLRFAFWNAEEAGRYGSANYTEYAANASMNISLYLNYDSSCYDPENRSVLDIMYNDPAEDIAALFADHNWLYGTRFTLTENNHNCNSDQTSFWSRGYPAIMTHSESHGPAHTPEDTIDKVSFSYAKKNAQLGMSVLAEIAGVHSSQESTPLR